jgi:hypothetical protein
MSNDEVANGPIIGPLAIISMKIQYCRLIDLQALATES